MAGRRRAARRHRRVVPLHRSAVPVVPTRDTERAERQRSVRALGPRRRFDGWTGRRGGRRYRAARRALAVLLLIVAGVSAARQADAAPGLDVVALSGDLPVGAVLTAADLHLSRVLHPPDGSQTDPNAVAGRRLNSAARRGEVVTDRRLVDTTGPSPGAGRSAVAVRPRDPALTQLLQVGTAVTVVGVTADGSVRPLSSQAWVLAVLDPDDGPGVSGRPVLLSVPDDEADLMAGATLTGEIALRLR